jgi:hypothetical protein
MYMTRWAQLLPLIASGRLQRTFAIPFLCALGLASCGGGGETPTIADRGLAVSTNFDSPVSPTSAQSVVANVATISPDALFDWAEIHFPQYFPSHRVTQTWDPYVYRFYPETSTYVAVNGGSLVQVLGPAFGGGIVTVGTIDKYTCDVLPQSCTPVANAGVGQTVVAGSVVSLNASGSVDPNSLPLSYQWTLASKPAGSSASLSNPVNVTPVFTADLAGTYTFTVTANDGTFISQPAAVTVIATSKLDLLQTTGDPFFWTQTTSVGLPYASSGQISSSSLCVGSGCPTDFTVASFSFAAKGGAFTIKNVTAVNLTSGSSVRPSFVGLVEGMTIGPGQTVPFALHSTFTGYTTVNLQYGFTVQETGQTFSYLVQLRTN